MCKSLPLRTHRDSEMHKCLYLRHTPCRYADINTPKHREKRNWNSAWRISENFTSWKWWLRNEVNNLRQGLENICQETRSTFLAKRLAQVSKPMETDIHADCINISDQRRTIGLTNSQSSLPPRPLPANTGNPNCPSQYIPIVNPSFQASSITVKVKFYSLVPQQT